MLVFGSRTKVVVLATLTLICNACHNPAAHQVMRRRTWFTLFFLPIFPFGSGKWTTQCTFCGQVSELTRRQAEELMASSPRAQAPAPVAPPTIPTDQPRP